MATEPTIQDAPNAVELTQVQGRVALENVHFSYDDGSPEVLHGVDLTVQPGETVAIVGPSGGGKSTLCQLVPRFYDPDSGVVSVDGTDVRRLTQHSLRRSIGIVQQDVFLFADTIRENIRYGKPDASDREVEEAARRAELYDDIAAMPDGFDTYVGQPHGNGHRPGEGGDILVSPESADLIVLDTVADFLLSSWKQRRPGEADGDGDPRRPPPHPGGAVRGGAGHGQFLRLDAVCSTGFRMARGKAVDMISLPATSR